jgi:hypothetical protein
MASRRKPYRPKGKPRRLSAAQIFNEFIKDLLAGTIQATKLIERRNDKRVELSYDDPNG